MNMLAEIDKLGTPEKQEQQQRYQIDTKDQAIWALKKMAKLQAEKKGNEDAAQIEIERVQAWLTEENEGIDRRISFFESLLREYHVKILETEPKKKTIKLPYGALKMRAQQPEYEYSEDELLPWVKDNLPDALVVKESVAKSTVKTYIKETGEVVPGVTITPRPDKFLVEVS